MPDILVVGSLHYDIVMRAPHLPRLDETVMGQDVQYICGGKGGNQAVSAARNGATVDFAGAVGADASAEILLANLRSARVDVGQVQRLSGASGMSVAIVDTSGDYGAVVASGANQLIDAGSINVSEDKACLVLQNEVPETVNISVAHRATGAKVILNAAPMRPLDRELLNRVDILILNRVEAAAFFGKAIESVKDAINALEQSTQRVPCIVLTLGADGLVYVEDRGKPHHVAARKVDDSLISRSGRCVRRCVRCENCRRRNAARGGSIRECCGGAVGIDAGGAAV